MLVLVYGAVRFTRFLADAASGAISPDLVLQILVVTLGMELPTLLPLAVYVAVLVSLGRLYRDSEIVALGACGVGLWQLARGVFWTVAAFAFVGGILSLLVSPSLVSMRAGLFEQAKHRAETRVFAPRRFKEFGGKDQVIYAEAIDPRTDRMSDVFVRIRRPDRQYVLVSDAAYQIERPGEGRRYMVLEKGYRYEGLPGGAAFSITRFERHAVRIVEEPSKAFERGRRMLATMALIGSTDSRHIVELHRRLSASVSIVVLGMLAVPLARTSPRGGRYGKLFLAVVVYFVYSNAISIFENLADRGAMPSLVGSWPVHAVTALVFAILLANQTSGGIRLRAKLRSAGRSRAEDTES